MASHTQPTGGIIGRRSSYLPAKVQSAYFTILANGLLFRKENVGMNYASGEKIQKEWMLLNVGVLMPCHMTVTETYFRSLFATVL